MTEIFKAYENKQNHFTSLTNQKLEISNLGNVKIDGVLIDFSKRHPSKYHQVHLLYVHRMVAETFIPNPENKPFVDHIDTNKLNNNANNLRWVTYKENNNNPITKQKQLDYFNKPGVRETIKKQRREYAKEHPMRRWLTDGKTKLFIDPEYWGEFLDIGFWFKGSNYNRQLAKHTK